MADRVQKQVRAQANRTARRAVARAVRKSPTLIVPNAPFPGRPKLPGEKNLGEKNHENS